MIYLVDDDIDDLEILREALLAYSYKGPVMTALNGQDLMNTLRKTSGDNRPDVIVMDLNMPLKNGFQTLQEIKGDPHLNVIPVIILTSSNSRNDEIKCFELGCAFFFRKPHRLTDYNPIVSMVKQYVRPEGDSEDLSTA